MAARIRLGEAEVELLEEGQGEPVLLLHGFPTTRLLWRGVVPLLAAEGYRVLAPDLIGYGLSTAPPGVEPSMANQARWMLALLDALGLDRVALVAHDVGTAAAQQLARSAPSRVRGLVLIDGVFRDEWAMDSLASILAWAPAESARLGKILVRMVRGSALSGRLDEALVREVLEPYDSAEGGLRLLRAAHALHPEETRALLPALASSGIPMQVIWGSADHFLPLETVGRPLAEALGAALEVISGGHFLPLERPAEVSAAVLRFLRGASI